MTQIVREDRSMSKRGAGEVFFFSGCWDLCSIVRRAACGVRRRYAATAGVHGAQGRLFRMAGGVVMGCLLFASLP